MTWILNAAVALFALTAVVLALVGALAWRRSGSGRMAILAAALGLFAATGAAVTYGLFRAWSATTLLTVQSVGVAAGLLVLYLAAVKR